MPEYYKEGIRGAFRTYCPGAAVAADAPFYAVVYYFHRVPSQQDADNISKPILDALEGLAYADDRLVKFRQAAMFDLLSDPLAELEISNLPGEVFSKFLEMLDTEEHILYVELGRLSFKQIRFGYEVSSEV
jgi:hypothetical protein